MSAKVNQGPCLLSADTILRSPRNLFARRDAVLISCSCKPWGPSPQPRCVIDKAQSSWELQDQIFCSQGYVYPLTFPSWVPYGAQAGQPICAALTSEWEQGGSLGTLAFTLAHPTFPLWAPAVLPAQKCFRGQDHFSVVHWVFLKTHNNTLTENTALGTTGKQLSIILVWQGHEREIKSKVNGKPTLPPQFSFCPQMVSTACRRKSSSLLWPNYCPLL